MYCRRKQNRYAAKNCKVWVKHFWARCRANGPWNGRCQSPFFRYRVNCPRAEAKGGTCQVPSCAVDTESHSRSVLLPKMATCAAEFGLEMLKMFQNKDFNFQFTPTNGYKNSWSISVVELSNTFLCYVMYVITYIFCFSGFLEVFCDGVLNLHWCCARPEENLEVAKIRQSRSSVPSIASYCPVQRISYLPDCFVLFSQLVFSLNFYKKVQVITVSRVIVISFKLAYIDANFCTTTFLTIILQ